MSVHDNKHFQKDYSFLCLKLEEKMTECTFNLHALVAVMHNASKG